MLPLPFKPVAWPGAEGGVVAEGSTAAAAPTAAPPDVPPTPAPQQMLAPPPLQTPDAAPAPAASGGANLVPTTPGGTLAPLPPRAPPPLPQPWRAVVDPNSGATYFFNSVTQQSQWEHPAPPMAPPPPPPMAPPPLPPMAPPMPSRAPPPPPLPQPGMVELHMAAMGITPGGGGAPTLADIQKGASKLSKVSAAEAAEGEGEKPRVLAGARQALPGMSFSLEQITAVKLKKSAVRPGDLSSVGDHGNAAPAGSGTADALQGSALYRKRAAASGEGGGGSAAGTGKGGRSPDREDLDPVKEARLKAIKAAASSAGGHSVIQAAIARQLQKDKEKKSKGK